MNVFDNSDDDEIEARNSKQLITLLQKEKP